MDGLVTDIPTATVERMREAWVGHETAIFLDVRTSLEYSKGHIARSINISLDELERIVEKMIPDKQATIYVYCLSGSRSIPAVKIMLGLGYTNVFNIPHGLLAWRAHGYNNE